MKKVIVEESENEFADVCILGKKKIMNTAHVKNKIDSIWQYVVKMTEEWTRQSNFIINGWSFVKRHKRKQKMKKIKMKLVFWINYKTSILQRLRNAYSNCVENVVHSKVQVTRIEIWKMYRSWHSEFSKERLTVGYCEYTTHK